MSMRKVPFIMGEYYHIYNRGTDKRIIFKDIIDLRRFFQSMDEFNTIEPIGSIWENKARKKQNDQLGGKTSKLVDFVCYCLNPNHYHFILTPLVEKGIEQFMQRLGTGFAMFFNERYDRTGSLFQGKFKAVHIDSDEYLMYVNVYVNLNNRVHIKSRPIGNSISKLCKSSWGEYVGENNDNFCNKEIVLDRFNSKLEYKKFAEETLERIIERKKEMEGYFLE